MLIRGYDMPRTKDGIPVDMMMNPHAIPSRMTVAQLIEALVGKAAAPLGTIGNGTLFMNDGSPVEAVGRVLRDELGMEPFGDELMYDGMGGQLIPTQMFIGNVFTMRLKHMPEDKWNARAEGRREQRTHQPTGGRGAQGGLRIGEMERDAILGHGTADFLRESLMKRADGYQTVICNGCGTIPIYNEREGLNICPTCDGPVRYIGDTASTLEILPPTKRSVATFSRVEVPYAFKLLDQELSTYLNMGLRVLTDKDLTRFRPPPISELTADQEAGLLEAVLPDRVLPETAVVAYLAPAEEPEVRPEDLAAMGATEDKEADRPPPVTPVPVPVPTQGNQGIVLQLGNINVGMQQPQQESGDDTEEVIQLQRPQVQQGQEQQQFQNNGQNQFQNQGQNQFQGQQQNQGQNQFQGQQQQNNGQQGGGSVNVQTSSQPLLIVPLSMNQVAPTEVINSPAPGAPQTIAVDTSDSAMRSLGLSSESVSRNRTPSRSRSSSGGSRTTTTNQPPPPAANVRVSVNKLG